MKKAALLFAVLIFASASIFAQDLRKKAETSPLDCAFYLKWKDKSEGLSIAAVSRLALAYFQIGRYEDLVNALNLIESPGDKSELFIIYSRQLLETGKKAEANRFLTEAVKNLDKEDLPHEDVLLWLVENLIEFNRADEAVNVAKAVSDEFEENDITLAVAEKFSKLGQTEKLNEFLAQPFFPHESENNLTRARTALLYARLKQTAKAKKILEEIKQTAFFGETETDTNNNRRKILPQLLRIHLEFGEIDKAFELWNQHGDQDNFYEFSRFIDHLITYNQKEKALPLIVQMQSNKEYFKHDGYKVVEAYLKIGDVESALYAAKTMSDEDDNFWQQNSFMTLADRFIADGKNDSALDILDFAFLRAGKIVFDHQSMDSIGASSGSRKIIYFGSIFQRLMKLKRFDKALAVVNSIGSNHSMANEFVVERLADFAGQQIKILPRKRIEAILAQMQTIVIDEDEEYKLINRKLLAAGIYAQMGEKQKAVEVLTKVLEEAMESCCYKEDFLLRAGKIFEQNKLKPDADMKKALKKFIKAAE